MACTYSSLRIHFHSMQCAAMVVALCPLPNRRRSCWGLFPRSPSACDGRASILITLCHLLAPPLPFFLRILPGSLHKLFVVKPQRSLGPARVCRCRRRPLARRATRPCTTTAHNSLSLRFSDLRSCSAIAASTFFRRSRPPRSTSEGHWSALTLYPVWASRAAG